MSDATFYKWKPRYGGLEVSEVKKLCVLEDENTRLKRLLADAMRVNEHMPCKRLVSWSYAMFRSLFPSYRLRTRRDLLSGWVEVYFV
ncbi:transposase [Neokomagataea sp. TBRC 2177]|uniref:Transposase n=1 Tax=Neokomagataea anthophila TaxID=2826925 RepID=A0ABS5E4K4_9PROT|nr:transposase [Neokomagataea anthophila]